MTQKNEGSCQCGAVKFHISGPFESFFLCHCSRCRKDTGSAHAANLFSTVAKIIWLSGEDRIKTYRVPESRHEKSFCSECGSAVPGIQMDGALLVVPAGSLDTPVDIRPNAHICLSSRANWDDGLDEVSRLEGLPG
ncbi:GFA family protein [Nitratireductor aquimarinus]|uniref:GFA family protein n=1 Tax=Nitratireductor TaxID=245876 RepID=UPI0019D36EED|nr:MULTISPECIES: GFA family protein [Nitratireductor]MBN7775634.1 GFA family protein [Nitratireductor pacificus]MBN7781901.1 GFA family protein [Nitratireductor pacificus]MBN7790707.1 GFA family protein [Nitratireductor aquimarinus]MBY6098381.1 GFA family protein [Nitratireductor aquimarinus]MCA1260277.1 GFA family protein [Nitratireductor aquimarinus]